MTEEERQEVFWHLRKEAKALKQSIACYRSKADRHFNKLAYIPGCAKYFDENRTSDNFPDFLDNPSREDMKAVFSGLYEAEHRLKTVEHRLAQFD